MKNHNKIMIIAGEASGDLHGANLVNELKQLMPDLCIKGMGGNAMKQAGVELLADISHFSVCGFIEVLGYLPKIYSLFKAIKKKLIEQPPDLLILIDYPTFNLKLAKIARKLNIKVLYYISPQIWAWHTSRIKKIQKNIKMMGVIFPFEAEFYQKYSVPVKYVGHPLVGKVFATLEKENIKNNYGIDTNKIVIGLLPGSRKNEIKYILPTLLKTADFLHQKNPNIQFIMPLADTLIQDEIQSYLNSTQANIKIITENRYNAMSICDAVVAASGTVTLELALLSIPMVIVYKAASLSFAIAKRVVKIPHIGLCNIVAGEKIVNELLQENANPETIGAELINLIENNPYRTKQKEQLAIVAHKLAAQKECSIGELAYTVLNN